MTENNTDSKNPEKADPDPRANSDISGTTPQSWKRLGAAPSKTRKTLSSKARWPGKCFKQEVVPGLFQSSQATVLELWASPEVLGPPGTLLDTSCSHTRNAQGTQKQKTTTLDRKMPQAFSRPRRLLELSGHHSGALGFP